MKSVKLRGTYTAFVTPMNMVRTTFALLLTLSQACAHTAESKREERAQWTVELPAAALPDIGRHDDEAFRPEASLPPAAPIDVACIVEQSSADGKPFLRVETTFDRHHRVVEKKCWGCNDLDPSHVTNITAYKRDERGYVTEMTTYERLPDVESAQIDWKSSLRFIRDAEGFLMRVDVAKSPTKYETTLNYIWAGNRLVHVVQRGDYYKADYEYLYGDKLVTRRQFRGSTFIAPRDFYFDDEGRVIEEVHHDPDGTETWHSWRTYNSRGYPIEYKSTEKGGRLVQHEKYTLDERGRVTVLTDMKNPTHSITYVLDARGNPTQIGLRQVKYDYSCRSQLAPSKN